MSEQENQSKRILIADDEPPIQETLKRLLEAAFPGCIVDTAGSGAEAMDCISREIYDLAILDVKMPGELSGLDVLRTIRAGFQYPVIVISGFGTMDVVIEAMRLGATDFLNKPIQLKQLRQSAERAFSIHHVQMDPSAEAKLKTTLEVEMPAEMGHIPELHRVVVNCLNSFGLTSDGISALWFSIHELVENAIDHGHKELPHEIIRIKIANLDQTVEAEIEDKGPGFDWKEALMSGSQEVSGGLGLVKSLANQLTFNAAGNKAKVMLVK